MAGSASASADSLAVTVQTATPEQGIPVNLQFSGSAGATDSSGDGPWLNAVVRPAGGLPCQSSYESDQAAAGGVSASLFNDGDWPEVGPGAFQESTTYNPDGVGSYLICAWLENNSNSVTDGPIGGTFGARSPQVSELSVAVASQALPEVGYQINYTTQTDQQLSLYSIVKPAGGLPCASSYELEQQQNQPGNDIFDGSTSVFGGPETTTATDTESSAGSYLICSWIEGPASAEVDAATSTPIYVGTPHVSPPPPTRLQLTPATELAAFLRWISSRYPTAGGYWVCPQAQISGGEGICLAEVRVGRRLHSLHAAAKVSGGKIILQYRYDTTWVRHWSRFSSRVIGGFDTPGAASVNSPAYDWAWLAAGAHYAWQHHRTAFSVVDFDGDSLGFARLFRFECHVRGRTITCTNALGDSMRYRPRG